jgi:hypothetical protein
MSDPGGCAVRRPPTAAEVVGRLKDDGDFDALRRAIVRKVKDNVSFPLNVNSPHPLPQGLRFRRSLVPNPEQWNFDAHATPFHSPVDRSSPLLNSMLGLIVCKRLEWNDDAECRVSPEFRPFGLL